MISAEYFKNLRRGRGDLVKPKEAAKPPEPPKDDGHGHVEPPPPKDIPMEPPKETPKPPGEKRPEDKKPDDKK